jgi:tripartite-type tricarboxylate transporter receptor subunit TctC
MQLHRRLLLHLVAAGAAYLTTLSLAYAQSYPTRSVHIIVGFPAGGTADIVARLVGQCLSEKLDQQFVIENRPGAGTNIATETVVRAPPDGYTLLATASTNTINPAFYSNLNFNFVRDITMVSGISRQPLVLDVYPSVPVTSVPELIAYAKANPGHLSMASFGTGTTSQAAIELFKMMAGVSLLHVPYHGSAPMVTDLLGGRVQTAIDALPTSLEHIRAGKLRALAVTTATRSEALTFLPSANSCRVTKS